MILYLKLMTVIANWKTINPSVAMSINQTTTRVIFSIVDRLRFGFLREFFAIFIAPLIQFYFSLHESLK